jgi:hypothetical protein
MFALLCNILVIAVLWTVMFILLNKVNCIQDKNKNLVKFKLYIWHCRAIAFLGEKESVYITAVRYRKKRKVSILLQSGIGRKGKCLYYCSQV